MIRVLIVEDETIIRQGIRSLIHWGAMDCQVVGECTNGLEAVSFLKETKVDIVITDIKMPGMDGLELCKHVYENYPSIQTIILTAYSEFTYAQTALKLRVHNYVIKTKFVKELPPAIEETVQYIKNLEQANSIQNRDHMKSLIFSGILDGSIAEPSKISYWLGQYNLDLENYFIVLSEMIFPGQFSGKTPDIARSMEAFKNFHDLAFQKYHCFSMWLQGNFLLNIIDFQEGTPSENMQSVVMVCNDVLSTVKNFMPFKLNMAISQHHQDVSELILAYREAHTALNRSLNENILSIFTAQGNEETGSELPDIYSTVDLLLKYYLDKETESAFAVLEQIVGQYKKSNQDLDRIKIEALLLTSVFFRKLTDNDINLENADRLEQACSQNIIKCRSLNAMQGIFQDLLESLSKIEVNVCSNTNYLVQMVNNIIREQYHTTLKLEDIAQTLHVNSSYLSRLYKKETGTSVITALNQFRIKKAKELLRSSQYRVSEVGALVGIEDPSYFTNVFTKYEGISPKEYKSNIR